jgi:hypothetical protein
MMVVRRRKDFLPHGRTLSRLKTLRRRHHVGVVALAIIRKNSGHALRPLAFNR